MATNTQRRKVAYAPDKLATITNRLQANRFLGYATFGAATARTDIAASTKSNIVPITGEVDDAARLMSIGPEAYVNEQLSDTSINNFFNATVIDANSGGTLNRAIRQVFWTELMHGSAQIRLKGAYALSQIFVVNTLTDSALFNEWHNKYVDNLIKATLSTNTSSFRELLKDVTFSRSMSIMLTYYNNKKANPAAFQKPDQNFIREILQLMCPGLYHLNLDGTYVLDANGKQIQTFFPDQIELLAGIITGLGDNTLGGPAFTTIPGQALYHNAGDSTNDAIVLPALLDGTVFTIPSKLTGAERLNFEMPVGGYIISNVTANTFDIAGLEPSRIKPNNNPVRPFSYRLTNDFSSNANRLDGTVSIELNATTATVTRNGHGHANGTAIFSKGNVRETFDYFLDWCFNHPSTAPFFAKSMIKHFVTSNPTPDYVKRVALKFINNGNGVRGDISAVIKAILLDKECLLDYGINPNNHGRYMTLPEKIGRVARALRKDNIHAHSRDNLFITGSAGAVFTKPLIGQDRACCGLYNTSSFRPYESGSIFNFFLPDFSPAGELLSTIGKLAPETQLEVSGTKAAWMNMVSQMCDTAMPSRADNAELVDLPTNFNLINNPTGNFAISGLDFTPPAAGYTIDTKTGTGVNGVNLTVTYTANQTHDAGQQLLFRVRRRSDGLTLGVARVTAPAPASVAGSPRSVTFTIRDADGGAYLVGDVLDINPLIITGYAGFPNRKVIDTANNLQTVQWHTYNILFHSIARLVPNTTAIPTAAELAPAIDYIESILMTRRISAQIRAEMVAIAQVARTPIAPYINGDAAFLNNWKYVVMDIAQQKARAMVFVLLVSPEFSSLR